MQEKRRWILPGLYPIFDRSLMSRFSSNWFNDELRSPVWSGFVACGMFWLVANNGAAAGPLPPDIEVGWRISSKKFAEMSGRKGQSRHPPRKRLTSFCHYTDTNKYVRQRAIWDDVKHRTTRRQSTFVQIRSWWSFSSSGFFHFF